ncbi:MULTISPECIES: cupin domain-containing protein [unclassified Imperialibacter]|uniref:cupin domain-containing protein n=1 Tax=unclassified Imperialibacter TaxID=2629706 RepID=UPI001253D7E8|nr:MULTISPECIES: cupin domain-containing protein [unclassified Imperialibacter]CAD5257015.1 conserved hypothetical protein [Imperialibacter sp. 75]CAD5259898.1 conserved hypothetical protein [Imperialibacter sp. 89]VVT25973.1 conserved hypothetical protein [Imperialibacter sp. EC-SDR9]
MRQPFFIAVLIGFALWSCTSTTEKKEEHEHEHENSHPHPAEGPAVVQDTLPKLTVKATEFSPEFVQLATNVEVIPNIAEAVKSVGVLTNEGVFGPLLFAEQTRAFFIELKPGMFLAEHPHPTESIVYTVGGRWVLCSEGKRQVMEAGSLFHFGSNMPTGWEAPFAESAFLLVVKTKEEGETYEPYVKGLREMKGLLEKERADGTEFYFNELPSDHPAIQFARSVNPDFDQMLNNIPY